MKKIQISILSLALIFGILSAVPALAISTTLGVTLDATASSTKADKAAAALATRIQTGQTRAGEEIDRRVGILNDLSGKVTAMTRLAAAQKSNISDFITQQVSALTALKTKILADTDIATLKTDIKSITDSYRIFMLVVPQVNVIRTTDATIETSQMLGTLGTKLQTRIMAESSAGNDVTSLNALLSDMNAKASDAQTQSEAAVTIVSPLKPDQGDAATIAANKQAFTTAKADLKTARADLETARQDAGKIVTALEAMKTASTSVTASSTTSAATQ